MESDPDPERLVRGPGVILDLPLDGDGGVRGPERIHEGREEGVSFGTHDVTAVAFDGATDDRGVLGVELVVARFQGAHQLHGALDVGAQERDGPFGQRHLSSAG